MIRRPWSTLVLVAASLAVAGTALAARAPVSPADVPGIPHKAATGGTGGGLVITTVDPAGLALTAACFELWTDTGAAARGTLVAATHRCDQPVDPTGKIGPQDGLRDGTLGWTGLAPGGYVVVETLPPALVGTAATYELAADARVAVSSGEVARLTLVHRPTAGLTLRKLDPAGRPLAGACFSLTTATRVSASQAIAARCDSTAPAGLATPAGDGLADGLLVFTALTPTGGPTSYTLHEVHPPDGYAAAPDQTVTVSPTEPTELTITDTTGGGGTGGEPIIGLELEIESTITIEKLTAMPVLNGVTTANGRIPLEGDVDSGNWHGSGELTSATSVAAGACPSMEVTGSGTYDWVVRSATASPDLAAGDLVVNMDSGPIVEAPDTFTMDTCSEPINGTLNTWENLFFDTYRSRFVAQGFRVDGWELVGGADAWAGGGVVAEARWAGTCGSAVLLTCSDTTTFRLIAVVIGTAPPASPGPAPDGGPLESASAAPSASADSSASPAPAGGGAARECTDLASCATSPLGIAAIFAAIVALGFGSFLWLRTLGSRQIVPIQSPTLNANAGDDPSMAEISLTDSSSGPIDYWKESTTALDKFDYDKLEGTIEPMTAPESASLPGENLDYDKLDYDKLGPLDQGGELPLDEPGLDWK